MTATRVTPTPSQQEASAPPGLKQGPMASCRLCQRSRLREVLDLGSGPITCWFPRPGESAPPGVALRLAVCPSCEVLQLANPPDPERLRPNLPIRLQEPEHHLDALAEHLLAGLPSGARLLGATYKDATLLQRLANGRQATVLPSLQERLERASFAEFAAALTPALAGQVQEVSDCDLLVARHLLEHVAHPSAFCELALHLLKPEGRLVVEVPDVTRSLVARNYTMVWEEHNFYFTGATLPRALPGLAVSHLECYPDQLDDILVAVAARGTPQAGPGVPDLVGPYCADLAASRQRVRSLLSGLDRPPPLFGAGHLAALFVSLYQVEDLLACALDDHPDKQGRLLPGTSLPIRPTSELAGERLCLTSLNPLSQSRVAQRQAAWLDSGGRFLSIFPQSEDSLWNL